MISAASSGAGAARLVAERRVTSTGVGLRAGLAAEHELGAESRRMCSRSAGPASAGTGTTAAPASSAAEHRHHRLEVGVASTATTVAPRTSSASGEGRAQQRLGGQGTPGDGHWVDRRIPGR